MSMKRYFSAREWEIYKASVKYYKQQRVYTNSAETEIELIEEMSPVDAAIDYEQCRAFLDDCIAKNSRMANLMKFRLETLKRSPNGPLVRKLAKMRQKDVAKEIRRLIGKATRGQRAKKNDVLVAKVADDVEVAYTTDEQKPEPASEKPDSYTSALIRFWMAQIDRSEEE